MGKLVLEELVIVQSSGVGSGMQKTAFNRIYLGNGHGWLVRMHGQACRETVGGNI